MLCLKGSVCLRELYKLPRSFFLSFSLSASVCVLACGVAEFHVYVCMRVSYTYLSGIHIYLV